MSKPGSSTQTLSEDEFTDGSSPSVEICAQLRKPNNNSSTCDDSPTSVTELESETEKHASKEKSTKYITLEVYYSRGKDVFKSAKPYFREAVLFEAPNTYTFRSFLRHGIFEKRPELKYRDRDVFLFQTPKGTNLLTLLDQPVDALPDLLAQSEQHLLKVIIKGDQDYKLLVDDQEITYRNPNGDVPAWPKTRLEKEEIPEEDSVHTFLPRSFALDKYALDDWENNRKESKRMIIIISVVFVLITAVATTLGVLLPDRNNGSNGQVLDQEVIITRSPTRSPVKYKPSKFQLLRDIVSQAVIDENLLFDRFSPQRLALNWLSAEDGANLGSNLCSPSDDDTPTAVTDDDEFGRRLRNKKQRNSQERKLVVCHEDERVIRRYALAVFYYATMDLPPPADNLNNDDDEFVAGDDVFRARKRRVEWMDDLNFLSDDHECSWHRNAGGAKGDLDIQGVICTDGVDGDTHVVLGDSESNNATIGALALNINENNLTRDLPAAIFQVQHLKDIRLGNNEMTGEISIDAESSVLVERIEINSNNFTGSIDFLLAFPNLIEARLGNNSFSGKIPSDLGQMVNLRVLSLGGNLLTGSMPDEICTLRREYELEYLEADCGGASPKIECDCCTSCSSSG